MYEKHWNDSIFKYHRLYSSFTSIYQYSNEENISPYKGFIKEVEILYLCLMLLKPIFDYKLIIDYD